MQIQHYLLIVLTLISGLLLSACGGSSNPVPVTNNGVSDGSGNDFAPSTYTATASVGDLILVNINRDALEMTFTNISYAPDASVTLDYVINPDGSYTIDPGGALETMAWELDGFGMVMVMHNTGPDLNESSLVIAVTPRTITDLTQFNERAMNIMQFRTSGGGMEVGHVTTGDNFPFSLAVTMYRPSDEEPFHTFDPEEGTEGQISIEAMGRWMEIDDSEGIVYAVDTPSGMLFIDNPNGSQLAMPAATSKDFSADAAGIYRGVLYEKHGITFDEHGAESGTVSVASIEVALSTTGMLSAINLDSGTALVPEDSPLALTPLADNAHYYDGSADKLQNPCHGMFTFNAGGGEVFLAIGEDALLFATYDNNGGDYSYAYGLLMRIPTEVVKHSSGDSRE